MRARWDSYSASAGDILAQVQQWDAPGGSLADNAKLLMV